MAVESQQSRTPDSQEASGMQPTSSPPPHGLPRVQQNRTETPRPGGGRASPPGGSRGGWVSGPLPSCSPVQMQKVPGGARDPSAAPPLPRPQLPAKSLSGPDSRRPAGPDSGWTQNPGAGGFELAHPRLSKNTALKRQRGLPARPAFSPECWGFRSPPRVFPRESLRSPFAANTPCPGGGAAVRLSDGGRASSGASARCPGSRLLGPAPPRKTTPTHSSPARQLLTSSSHQPQPIPLASPTQAPPTIPPKLLPSPHPKFRSPAPPKAPPTSPARAPPTSLNQSSHQPPQAPPTNPI